MLVMRTSLSPERLAELHTEGRARVGAFVDPHIVSKCAAVLYERGEEWGESVLMRKFTRRSRLYSALPWLESGEEEILVLADEAEWTQLATGLK
jgi:hypothetical protein